MKHMISRRYILSGLESMIGLENVPETIGWGQWCEKHFLYILRSRGVFVSGIKATPLFDGDGNLACVDVTAKIY